MPRTGPSRLDLGAAQLRSALEHDPNPLVIVDAFDRIQYANPACANLFGSGLDYLLGARLFGVVASVDPRPRPTSVLERAEEGVEGERLVLPDGRTQRASVTLLRDEQGIATHACLRLWTYALPAPPPPLASLTRLAAQLTHDVNNQLAAALNYISILRRRLEGVEPLASHLDELHAATWRAAALMTGWRTLTPAAVADGSGVELQGLLQDLEPLFIHAAPQVTLEIVVDAGLPVLDLPLAQVEQIVVATALWSLRHSSPGSRLVVRTHWLPAAVRLSFERSQSDQPIAELKRAKTSVERGLRRALKRCHARLGHDAQSVFVDFPT